MGSMPYTAARQTTNDTLQCVAGAVNQDCSQQTSNHRAPTEETTQHEHMLRAP
jgi:hypothetical protein